MVTRRLRGDHAPSMRATARPPPLLAPLDVEGTEARPHSLPHCQEHPPLFAAPSLALSCHAVAMAAMGALSELPDHRCPTSSSPPLSKMSTPMLSPPSHESGAVLPHLPAPSESSAPVHSRRRAATVRGRAAQGRRGASRAAHGCTRAWGSCSATPLRPPSTSPAGTGSSGAFLCSLRMKEEARTTCDNRKKPRGCSANS